MSDTLVAASIDRLTEAVTAQTEVLKTLNDNIVRLTFAQIGALDGLQMIRRASDRQPGEYSDPYAGARANEDIDPDAGAPVLYNARSDNDDSTYSH